MVKKISLLLVLVFSPFLIMAGDVNASLDTSMMYIGGRGEAPSLVSVTADYSDFLVFARTVLSYSASSNAVKGEVKASASYYSLSGKAGDAFSLIGADTGNVTSLSLDKAWVKLRFPLFSEKRKTTFTFGKAPVSWGKGYYYRCGDVLLENGYSNSEAGESTERNIWAVTADQSFGTGFALSLGYSLPLEGQKNIAAVNLRKTIDTGFLKGIYLSYACRFDSEKRNKLSLSLDGTLFFDYVIGGETTFSSSSDFLLVFNAMKQFALDTEAMSHTLALYLGAEYSFEEKRGEGMASLSFDITERLSSSLSALLSFTGESIGRLTSSLALEATVNDSVSIGLSASWIRDFPSGDNLYSAGVSVSSDF